MDCALTHDPAISGPPRRVSPFTHAKIVLLSLAGGALGIAGAFVSELQTGGFLLIIFIGAPIIEEALKPIGVYLSLVRWPRALQSRLYVALLCAGAGAVFGFIESAVYVWVYVPDHPEWYEWFRFTVSPALHALFSFTVGLGLDRRVVEWVTAGTPLPRRTVRFYIAGVALHAAFNTTAVILSLAGVFDF